MKIYVSNLLQYGKWAISDQSKLISFPFHYIFIDVEPHFVSNLELVINLVLVMSGFLLSLNLLQLILH